MNSLSPDFDFILLTCVQAVVFSLLASVLFLVVQRLGIRGKRMFLFASLSVLAVFWALALLPFHLLPVPNLLPKVAIKSPPAQTESETIGTEIASDVSATSLFSPAKRSELALPKTPPNSQLQTRVVQDKPSNIGVTGNPQQQFTSTWITSSPWKSCLAVMVVALVTLGVTRFLISLLMLWRFRQTAKSINNKTPETICSEFALELGIERRVICLESSSINSACTFGYWNPKIVLPREWKDWTQPELRSVIAHELAHIAHLDFLRHLLSRFSTAVHFYNPLVHWLAARLRLEQEFLADATVRRFFFHSLPANLTSDDLLKIEYPEPRANQLDPTSLLAFTPVRKDIQVDATFPRSSIHDNREKFIAARIKGENSSFQLTDQNGKLVRKALDTNKDMKFDQWVYYRDGVEVYRDIDSDFDRKIDTCRFTKHSILFHGTDSNQDGVFDSFSPEYHRIVASHAGDLILLGKKGDQIKEGQIVAKYTDTSTYQHEINGLKKLSSDIDAFNAIARKKLNGTDDQWKESNIKTHSKIQELIQRGIEHNKEHLKKIAALEKKIAERTLKSPVAGKVVEIAKPIKRLIQMPSAAGKTVVPGELILSIVSQ